MPSCGRRWKNMRPVRIELEGFGPYRKRQVVDLEGADLFVITGPTGSGKTTLLDAITFALYGRVHRLGSRRIEEMRHPEAERMWVSLTFQVDGRVYRVEREVGRRREVRVAEHLGERWQIWDVRGRNLEGSLERILGMDYDTFVRTVLLPQGEFDRFLRRDKGSERRKILDHLFGLDVLQDMRTKASERKGNLESRIAALEAELESLKEATPEALEQVRNRMGQVKKALEAKTSELKKVQDVRDHFRALLALYGEKARLQEELSRLMEAEPALLGDKERAELSQRARELVDLLAEKEKAEALLKELKEADAQLEEERDALARELDLAELERLEGLWAQRAYLRSLHDLLGKAGEKPALHPEASPWEEEDEAALREVLEELPRMEKARELKEKLVRQEKELSEVEAGLQQTRMALVQTLQAEVEELEERLGHLERHLGELGVARFRHLLRPGEPCPLCLTPVQALPPALEEGKEKELEGERKQVERQLARKRVELERLLTLVGQEVLPAKVGVVAALEKEETRLARQADELRVAVGSLKKALADLEVEDLDLEEEFRHLGQEKHRLALSLAHHLAQVLGGKDLEDFMTWLEERLRHLRGQKKRLEELEERRRKLREELGLVLARLEEKVRALEQAWKDNPDLPRDGKALRALLLDEAEEKRALEDWEKHRDHVLRVEGALESLEARLQELAPLPETPPTQEDLEALEKRLEDLSQEIGELSQELGELRGELVNLEGEVKRRVGLEEDLRERRRQFRIWEALTSDLQQRAFPEWLHRRLQRALLVRANEILHQLSSGRYSLRVREESGLEYEVYDAWTGVHRSAHTLSGGESFLASLALALALSEELARRKLEAFFLDEGFGTLDGETLEVVAQALEGLGRQNRMIGVITHVESLAQRFPMRLRVRKGRGESVVEWVD